MPRILFHIHGQVLPAICWGNNSSGTFGLVDIPPFTGTFREHLPTASNSFPASYQAWMEDFRAHTGCGTRRASDVKGSTIRRIWLWLVLSVCLSEEIHIGGPPLQHGYSPFTWLRKVFCQRKGRDTHHPLHYTLPPDWQQCVSHHSVATTFPTSPPMICFVPPPFPF